METSLPSSGERRIRTRMHLAVSTLCTLLYVFAPALSRPGEHAGAAEELPSQMRLPDYLCATLALSNRHPVTLGMDLRGYGIEGIESLSQFSARGFPDKSAVYLALSALLSYAPYSHYSRAMADRRFAQHPSQLFAALACANGSEPQLAELLQRSWEAYATGGGAASQSTVTSQLNQIHAPSSSLREAVAAILASISPSARKSSPRLYSAALRAGLQACPDEALGIVFQAAEEHISLLGGVEFASLLARERLSNGSVEGCITPLVRYALMGPVSGRSHEVATAAAALSGQEVSIDSLAPLMGLATSQLPDIRSVSVQSLVQLASRSNDPALSNFLEDMVESVSAGSAPLTQRALGDLFDYAFRNSHESTRLSLLSSLPLYQRETALALLAAIPREQRADPTTAHYLAAALQHVSELVDAPEHRSMVLSLLELPTPPGLVPPSLSKWRELAVARKALLDSGTSLDRLHLLETISPSLLGHEPTTSFFVGSLRKLSRSESIPVSELQRVSQEPGMPPRLALAICEGLALRVAGDRIEEVAETSLRRLEESKAPAEDYIRLGLLMLSRGGSGKVAGMRLLLALEDSKLKNFGNVLGYAGIAT